MRDSRISTEGNLRQHAVIAVEDMIEKKFPLEKHAGKVLHACVTGDAEEGYAYMVTFPVRVNRKNAEV